MARHVWKGRAYRDLHENSDVLAQEDVHHSSNEEVKTGPQCRGSSFEHMCSNSTKPSGSSRYWEDTFFAARGGSPARLLRVFTEKFLFGLGQPGSLTDRSLKTKPLDLGVC